MLGRQFGSVGCGATMGQERELGCTGKKEKGGERSWATRWLIRPEEKGEGRRDGPLGLPTVGLRGLRDLRAEEKKGNGPRGKEAG
jgi:hypothetical protein